MSVRNLYNTSHPYILFHFYEMIFTLVCLYISPLRISVRLKNDTAYLTGNEGKTVCEFFSENAPLQRFGIICVSRQCVRPCLLFLMTEASLVVEKGNDILSILETSVNECRRWQASIITNANTICVFNEQ